MKYKEIEYTLRKIIEIDNEATSTLEEIDVLKETRKKQLRKMYRDLEFEIMRKARKDAKAKHKEILAEANGVVDQLAVEADLESDKVRKIINDNKEKLAGELYKEIFDF